MQPAFAAGRASHNGAAFTCTRRGSGLDREAFDYKHDGRRYYRDGLRYLQTPNNSRSRPLPPLKHARPVGAVSTAKLLIQNPQWSAGFCRDRLRYLPPPNHSRSRPLPHINARPVGAVSTGKLLIHTHDEAPAITETACAISRRRRIRVQDRSHMSNARAVGAVSTAKLLIQNPQWSTGLLPRQPAIPPDAEQLAVNTAPTRQMRARGSGLDREAFDPHARRGAGYYRDGLRYLQTPNDSRSRPIPLVNGRWQRGLMLTWLNAIRVAGQA